MTIRFLFSDASSQCINASMHALRLCTNGLLTVYYYIYYTWALEWRYFQNKMNN